jgi:hypothetical protein
MLVFLFGNACTNIHVCVCVWKWRALCLPTCDCNYTQQFRYLGHIDTSPRIRTRFFRERKSSRASWMSFIFIVCRLDPAYANCQKFWFIALSTTTVTFCYFSRRPEVRKLHTLLAICVHADGRRFCAFPFGPASDEVGNFSFAHLKFATLPASSKLVSICMYRA